MAPRHFIAAFALACAWAAPAAAADAIRRVSTPAELAKALLEEEARHVVITEHLDLRNLPHDNENQPDDRVAVFYLSPTVKTIRGECEGDVPDAGNGVPALMPRLPGQCVLTTNVRVFEWSMGEPYKVLVDNIYLRHVHKPPYNNLDMLYWNMNAIDDDPATDEVERQVVAGGRLFLTRVYLQSGGKRPAMNTDTDSPLYSVTGLYAEGGLVYLYDCRFEGLAGNAVDVQSSRVAIESTTFKDVVSWDAEFDVVDGIVVLESAPPDHMAAVRIESSEIVHSGAAERYGSDYGSLGEAWLYIDDVASARVNPKSVLKPLGLDQAQSNWAGRNSPELKLLQQESGSPALSSAKGMMQRGAALALGTIVAGALVLGL